MGVSTKLEPKKLKPHAIQTPWGTAQATSADQATRDPAEADPPITIVLEDAMRIMGTNAPIPPTSRSSPVPASPRITAPAPETDDPNWPAQVELVLSALEAGRHTQSRDRRSGTRKPVRIKAALRLFSDAPDAAKWILYTRDLHARGMGFLTSQRMPLGYGGIVEFAIGSGEPHSIPCTLLRCRQAAPGWFEGALYFNREQPRFNRI